jgi:hypothetical protein
MSDHQPPDKEHLLMHERMQDDNYEKYSSKSRYVLRGLPLTTLHPKPAPHLHQ